MNTYTFITWSGFQAVFKPAACSAAESDTPPLKSMICTATAYFLLIGLVEVGLNNGMILMNKTAIMHTTQLVWKSKTRNSQL